MRVVLVLGAGGMRWLCFFFSSCFVIILRNASDQFWQAEQICYLENIARNKEDYLNLNADIELFLTAIAAHYAQVVWMNSFYRHMDMCHFSAFFELWTVFRPFLGTLVENSKHKKVAPDNSLNFPKKREGNQWHFYSPSNFLCLKHLLWNIGYVYTIPMTYAYIPPSWPEAVYSIQLPPWFAWNEECTGFMTTPMSCGTH